MSRSRPAALAVAALLVTLTVVNLANGQERPGGRGRFGGFARMIGSPVVLIANEKVQQELELLDDQKAELKKVTDELRAGRRQGGPGQGGQQLSDEERQKLFAEMEARNKAALEKINAILLPHQAERLKEISLQVRGSGALAEEEVAKELSITDEQKQKLDAIQQERFEQMRALFQQGGEGDQEANRQKFAELQTATNEKLLAVLTDEQRQQFEKMQGEKFEGIEELRRPPGGFGRGGPGGPGGRRGARPAQGNE